MLRHNDRINTVQRLMHSYNNVNKFLHKQNASEEVLIQRLEQQEAKQKGGDAPEEAKGPAEPKPQGKKWKQKFIKIWQYNEQLEQLGGRGEMEQQMGPRNFVPIMKLGQGSFGQVYLVEKVLVLPDGATVNTGKQYAMKILNKKQILGNNLVKYAKTERDVLSYTKHPFIVGFKHAF